MESSSIRCAQSELTPSASTAPVEEPSLLMLQPPPPPPPRPQHLVLIGGGHAHVQVVKALRARPAHVHVTLIDVVAAATYSGMVPGCLAGVYTANETLLPLQPLAEWANCTFVQDAVVDIDLEQRFIYLQNAAPHGAAPIHFDAVSLDIGSVSRGYDTTVGARDHAIPTRPIHALVARLNQARRRRDHNRNHAPKNTERAKATSIDSSSTLTTSPVTATATTTTTTTTTAATTTTATAATPVTTKIVVIGGGVAGMELAMVVTSRWRQDNEHSTNGNNVECTILDANPRRDDDNDAPLDAIRSVLASKRIAIRHGCHVVRIDEHVIHCLLTGKEDQDLQENSNMVTTIPYTHCIWATGAGAHALPKHLIAARHLDGTADGWITVQPTLQSTSHDCVFAAGDCAHMVHHDDIPKAGVYAVRSGPILIENLTRYLESIQSRSNKPRSENPNGATGEKVNDGRPHPMPPSTPQLIPYVPQDDFLKLLVCGDGTALGFRFGLVLQGKWVFELKDHIDRSFMKLFDVASFEPEQGEMTSPGRYDTRQYDSDLALDEVRFSPAAAANLLQRTDDAVDFREAQVILRIMGNDVSFRQAVLKCIQESKIGSAA
jgi:NADH dehydrogenase FAD-containing subunit